MGNTCDKEQVQVESRAELRAWLAQYHGRTDGVWLVTFKKHRPDKYVAYDELVEEAICFGWIDSLPRKLDEDRTMHWLTPRKPGSGWSRRNKERVERLQAAGMVAPADLEIIEAAQADGSWSVLDAIEALEIPPDLEKALSGYASARVNFEAFPRSVKRSILAWRLNARRPETRARRVEETARLAQDNIRANQWRG
jgi:uncharacterized protein YdeI (YjbR/CyaY-like superfamily)